MSLMLTPFSPDDLASQFEPRILTRGRTLVLLGTVDVALQDDAFTATVEHLGQSHSLRLAAKVTGGRTLLRGTCTCATPACAHMAAAGLAALDRFPSLRAPSRPAARPDSSPTASKSAPPGTLPEPGERQQLQFSVIPVPSQQAIKVAAFLVGERSGARAATTPQQLLALPGSNDTTRLLARLLGGGDEPVAQVATDQVPALLDLLRRLGNARLQGANRPLKQSEDRVFPSNVPPNLPTGSAVVLGKDGLWFIDATTGATGRIRLRPPTGVIKPRPGQRLPGQREPAKPAFTGRPRAGKGVSTLPAISADPVIHERRMTPVLRLRRVDAPDEQGRLVEIDALCLDFDYAGTLAAADDERQFVPASGMARGADAAYLRRDREAEAAALEILRVEGFNQMRVADSGSAKGRTAFVFRGRDSAERWQIFLSRRVPELLAEGWTSRIEGEIGPRQVENVGIIDMTVADATSGRFELDFGIEIDGRRVPLLPILQRLLDQGGLSQAQIIDGEIITSLDDGRILRLPAERIGRLLAVLGDLIEAASRTPDDALLLDRAEVASVVDLEQLLLTRYENAAAIEAYANRYRGETDIPHATLPDAFKATLRPYQQQGVDWLQHLRAHDLGGFLADDMGLGKTAQTIAHICIEHQDGRLDRPALIVVPTSLVANWTAELAKFAPHLRFAVLHGLDRHALRETLGDTNVVITTYTVLTRDIEAMARLAWHLVVLDEAQIIKSPDAKVTRAVCRLDTRHRLCLSGTPIENNLQELWSEFAFLMPGLLGDRKTFAKRFRNPIEKANDPIRRGQLIRRIRPFLMRRTKSEVATDLPPRHTILRRIDLAPEQRELYETIRGMLHEQVREQIATLSAAQSRIVVLDALLKLRQVCCDPRLVKLESARKVATSSKLDGLMEMMTEMFREGRRILLFSQFTSMLDLIKLRLAEAKIGYVELRGDTRDRAEPVRAFEAGEVPLFLISLKAGGRGLNLTSADTVIHYDPWWNPAAEDQASDRAHRIGQTKSVFVYKLIAADTVEDRIVELQRRKSELANIALGGEDDEDLKIAGAIDQDDLAFLFGTQDKMAA